MQTRRFVKPGWRSILDHIAHNVKEFRRLLGHKVAIMAVVKADGYGHGAVELPGGSQGEHRPGGGFAGRRTRPAPAGIEAPILLFGSTGAEQVRCCCNTA